MSQADKDTIDAHLASCVMRNATHRRAEKLLRYGLRPTPYYGSGKMVWTAEETDKLLALLRKLPEE